MIKLADIATIALARSEAPALVSPEYSLTWDAFEATTRSLVAALRTHLDLGSIGQAVFVSENRIELILIMAAFNTLKIPLCGIDYLLRADSMRAAIDSVGGDCLILSSRQLGSNAAITLSKGWKGAIIDLDDHLEGALSLSTLMLPVKAHSDDAVPEDRSFRAVAFTSGTSGSPKPTLRTKSCDARRFSYFTVRYGLHSGDRYLLNMPLYHVAGSGWARHFLGLGATLYLVPVDQPKTMAEAILTCGITAFVTTPVNLSGMIDAMTLTESRPGHSLRFVLVGGKNFSPTQKRRALEVLGPVIHEYYGSTETGVNAIAEPSDLVSHTNSVGRPYDGQRIIVVDDQDRVLPAGSAGRIAVSSFLLMDSYIDGSASEIRIGHERFLVTPDRGYLDDQSRLYVLNRSSGGDGNFDVYSVEEEVRRVPGVKDVAILMEPSVEEGRRIADCALVLKSDSLADDIVLQRVRDVLASENIEHRSVRAIDRIPYSLSGKVRWPDLSVMLANPGYEGDP